MNFNLNPKTKEYLIVITLIVLIVVIFWVVLPAPNILRQVPPSF